MSPAAAALAAIGSRRLAVRMPNWLGDAMFALPALRALRRLAPEAELELHARRPLAEVLEVLPGLADRVVSGCLPTPRGLLADRRSLAGAAACFLLPNSFAAALPPWLARVPLRVGARGDGRTPLLTTPLPRPSSGHQAARYLALVDPDLPLDPAAARVTLSAAAVHAGRELTGEAPYAALAPGAAFGPAKRWGEDCFGELGQRLVRLGLAVLVLGSRSEAALAERIARASGGRSLAGLTGGGALAGIVAGARLVAGNDSGVLHLASALGTPIVALYGATSPAATGPLGARVRLLYHPVACSPCGLRVCRLARHECMEGIATAAAAAAAETLLAPAAIPGGA